MNFEERINKKKLNVDCSFSSGEIYVDADREKIERVIYNLFDNAIKFLLEGGDLSAKITAQNNRAEITISDTGIGMNEEEQKRAFERFYKADSSRGMDKKGSGLGLSIVQGLLKMHGETIKLESEKYEGTTFKFSLPISKNENIK
jgi:signal transduction histidine kinase